MSMLTSQCKQLHDMANDLREHYTFVGFGGVVNRDPTIFLAARQMDDAADTIERLREELHDLLYVQAHWELDHCPNCEARLDLMVLRDENAKLRELAMRFADYVGQDRCEGCVTKTSCDNGLMDECFLLTEIREIADGLGIEVE